MRPVTRTPGTASPPPPSAAVYRCSGGLRRKGAPFVARRAVNPHGCAPASRDPFPQIPAFECRCIRSGCVARPHRTALGTPRSGALPEAAHQPSRCTASSGTAPWTPASLRPPPAAAAPLVPVMRGPGAVSRLMRLRDPRRSGGATRSGGDIPGVFREGQRSVPTTGCGDRRAEWQRADAGRERNGEESPASQGPSAACTPSDWSSIAA